ncbi:MAG TPA: YgcG family protein, partial [Candidatus Saccharimonadia bacterium]|nr:YgcG family protein [Candidatus Saccharimonadia bacterium]
MLLCASLVLAAELPKLAARVTDLTGTLHAPQVAALEAKLAAVEQRKGSQVAVVVVPTTQPDTIEQYAVALFEHNAIGRKGVDDGVLLLVAKEDRKVRIEVGYGLEGAIPDLYAIRIIDEYVTPRFRNGDFYGGIDEATSALAKLIDGEALPEPLHEAPHGSGDLGGSVMFAVFIGFFAAQLAAAFVRKRAGRRILAGGTLAAIASA